MRRALAGSGVWLMVIGRAVVAMAGGADTDSDGVPDVADVCSNTPAGVAVDSTGRPYGDLDGDCDNDLVDFALYSSGFTGPLPPVASTAPGVGDLVITEIMQNPVAVPDADGEWFEVLNVSDHVIDLMGVTFQDNGGESEPIGATLTVGAGERLVFGREADTGINGGVAVDYTLGSFTLGNEDDEIIIIYDSTIIDEVTYDPAQGWPDPNGAAMQLSGSLDPATADNDDPANWCEARFPYASGDFGSPGSGNPACPRFAPGDLVITEIMPAPVAVADSLGEWFEVTNTTALPVDLLGLTIQDAANNVHTIGTSTIVSPGGFAVLGVDANPGANGGVSVDYVYTGILLQDTVDEIILIDAGLTIDAVQYDQGLSWPVAAGTAMQLNGILNPATSDNNDPLNWCKALAPYGDGDLGSPGSANPQCPPLVPGDLAITEIMQNPAAVGDADGEWFEVANTSNRTLELLGAVISDLGTDMHTISSSVVLTPGQRVVLGINGESASNGGVPIDYAYSGMTLSNADDEIVISYNAVVIDSVAYDGGSAWPDPNGASMQFDGSLSPDSGDNDNAANWCASTTSFGDGDLGTPGSANTTCP